MRRHVLTSWLLFLSLLCASVLNSNAGPVRHEYLLDRGWRFHLGNAADPEKDFDFGLGGGLSKAGEAAGAARPEFNDSSWRIVDLPHDWAVELGFVQSTDSDVEFHGFKPLGRRYPETSIGWYRRSFSLPSTVEGTRTSVRFDGAYRDCIVWLNGHFLGRNMSGYSECTFDISDYIVTSGKNTLVVRVDATHNEGWFYEGAGLYRHVWLETTGSMYIPRYGIFVHTQHDTVTVESQLHNEGPDTGAVELESTILDKAGNIVTRQTSPHLRIAAGGETTTMQSLIVHPPHLWSLDDPYLYTLVSRIRRGEELLDSTATVFGIRTILFDKDRGFFLNGKSVKIKGVCCHQDHAGVGSALPDRLQYYRIEKLKEMGCNAYRTSHNPPTRELLDACDRRGMLVMDESRLMGSTPEWTGQFERLVLRDRNHPSVVLWSIGNEEYKIQNTTTGERIARTLLRHLRRLDPTRLATYAANNGNHYEGINSVLPMRGFNYMNITNIDKYRAEHPDQILIGSEEASTLCTRGIYANDTVRGYVADLDVNKPAWGATAEQWWSFYAERSWLAGAFVWTGFDYRGEPTPYHWPCINSHFGIMDVCGFPKNNYYYYQAWWSDRDVLHLAPHWNWAGKEGTPLPVWCQSNCDSVELEVNGKSLGWKSMPSNSHLDWTVMYAPGKLLARGYRHGRSITTAVETTGPAVRVKLIPDRTQLSADGEDVAVITVEALDAKGMAVPVSSHLITFSLQGPGRIIGVGNGDPSSHEPDKFLHGDYQRSLFNGKCQVIVQSQRNAGGIAVTAAGAQLEAGTVRLTTTPARLRPSLEP